MPPCVPTTSSPRPCPDLERCGPPSAARLERSTTGRNFDEHHRCTAEVMDALHMRWAECQFVGAGMGFIAHEQLAAAVTNAGGLGVLGSSPDPADSLPVMVERFRRRILGIQFDVLWPPRR